MKQSVFVTIVLVVSLATGFIIWTQLPAYLQEGGPLVAILIALSVMLLSFIAERLISLRKAKGRASIQSFFKKVVTLVQEGDFGGALAACDKQRGSCANVLRAGIDRYGQIRDSGITSEKKLEETQRAIEEANALEVPLLERNLIVLSSIASIATMVGLLGTTIGMIRAFNATGHASGGVIDATSLATGISEALVNTAGGLFNAIVGIVAYNFFVNKVDSFNYTVDEASYEILQLIKAKEVK
ncbi:MAG: MotA/TolQ/ExbB proton channel family protein [candidate division Zixibacteria bacterium]|nr:MotA/TolQ/ExbB proton channel family protein [candidate division Zixibacteria bacterium]MBU1471236.1 MotA/TolQ/ExbB proton channel family protein [candidate division Zixibacteria bacterium]MBU2624938.1 MotA/TolQ/ExbB proton channel family protein [candidate division Zixibacteria bacterium]